MGVVPLPVYKDWQAVEHYLLAITALKTGEKCTRTARKLNLSPAFALRWLPRQRV
jgi:hypothetical protein